MTDGLRQAPRREIVSHTSIRGIAAVLVAVTHISMDFGAGLRDGPLAGLFLGFDVFVDLFFVLSGFIISFIYAPVFAAGVSLRGFAAFMARRFARLAPLHYLTMAAMIGILVMRGEIGRHGPLDLPANLAMVQAWVPSLSSYNPPAWSISAEWGAYLVFPAVAWIAVGRGVWSVPLVAAVALYAVLFTRFDGMAYDPRTLMLRGLGGFLTGMLVWKLWSLRLVPDRAFGVVQVVSVALIFATLQFGWPHALLPPAFGALILATADDRGPVARLLQAGLLHRLGLWSYSIYLNHTVVIAIAWAVRVRIEPGVVLSAWIWLGATLAVTIALSAVTFRWIEVGAKDRLTRLLHARASGARRPV